jgi:hypothetical protein
MRNAGKMRRSPLALSLDLTNLLKMSARKCRALVIAAESRGRALIVADDKRRRFLQSESCINRQFLGFWLFSSKEAIHYP